MEYQLCLLLLFVVQSGRTEPMRCNGMEGLCDLRFDQVTFPGTHNSAANTAMYYGSDIQAASCSYQNQDRGIFDQLEDGIRMLDLDTCYRYEEGYFGKRIWACHCGFGTCAYIHPIRGYLDQIVRFLNLPQYRNEVVFLRFHDTDLSDFIHLGGELRKAFADDKKPDSVKMNKRIYHFEFPTLREAITANRRVFVYVNGGVCNNDCLNENDYVRSLDEYHDTWDSTTVTAFSSCKFMIQESRTRCEKFKNDKKIRRKPMVYLSLFGSYGICNGWMASKCNKHIEKAAMACHGMVSTTSRGHTVNVIAVDYYERGQNVTQIARKLNEITIKKHGNP